MYSKYIESTVIWRRNPGNDVSTKEIRKLRDNPAITRFAAIRRNETRPLMRSRPAAKSFSAEKRQENQQRTHSNVIEPGRTDSFLSKIPRIEIANTPRSVMTFPNQNTNDRNETLRFT